MLAFTIFTPACAVTDQDPDCSSLVGNFTGDAFSSGSSGKGHGEKALLPQPSSERNPPPGMAPPHQSSQ